MNKGWRRMFDGTECGSCCCRGGSTGLALSASPMMDEDRFRMEFLRPGRSKHRQGSSRITTSATPSDFIAATVLSSCLPAPMRSAPPRLIDFDNLASTARNDGIRFLSRFPRRPVLQRHGREYRSGRSHVGGKGKRRNDSARFRRSSGRRRQRFRRSRHRHPQTGSRQFDGAGSRAGHPAAPRLRPVGLAASRRKKT